MKKAVSVNRLSSFFMKLLKRFFLDWLINEL